MHQNDQIDISIFLIIYIHCCDLSKMLIICTDYITFMPVTSDIIINTICHSTTSMTEILWVYVIQCWRKINIQIITIKCYDGWDPRTSTPTVNIVFWNVMCIIHLYIALALLNFHFSCIYALYECRINSVEPVTHPCAFSVFSDSPDIVWIQVNTLLVTSFLETVLFCSTNCFWHFQVFELI